MNYIKDLTGKDSKAYTIAASYIIDTANVDLFAELVSKDDVLFDFVKRNVAQRLENACNENNFKNLLKFLKIYSPYYDDFISSTLAKYSDNEIEEIMLGKLKNGSEDEKTYAASYFSYIENSNTLIYLRDYMFSENADLASNGARALSKLKDKESYNIAIKRLQSEDSFEQYEAVKFLVNFQDKSALKDIFLTMKKSSMADAIASEIPYLETLTSLLNTEYKEDAILTFCYIVNSLAEVTSVSQIIDYEFYDFINILIKSPLTGSIAIALMMAREKFELFMENEEYLFDEDKNTKTEAKEIFNLLNTINTNKYSSAIYEELYEESDFISFALDLTKDEDMLVPLLNSKNQTVVLKVLSILKSIGKLKEEHKITSLKYIKDENLRQVAKAL